MFEHFPYTDMHQLNLDWIIKIAKDFLDQYTQIQETISQGLEDLDTKAENLQQLLQEWYDTHSQDIADQLADALQDLNEWYTQHQNYLDNILATKTAEFNALADEKTANSIASIPADYTALSNNVTNLNTIISEMGTESVSFQLAAGTPHSSTLDLLTTTIGAYETVWVVVSAASGEKFNAAVLARDSQGNTTENKGISADTLTPVTPSANSVSLGVYVPALTNATTINVLMYRTDSTIVQLYFHELELGQTLDYGRIVFPAKATHSTRQNQLNFKIPANTPFDIAMFSSMFEISGAVAVFDNAGNQIDTISVISGQIRNYKLPQEAAAFGLYVPANDTTIIYTLVVIPETSVLYHTTDIVTTFKQNMDAAIDKLASISRYEGTGFVFITDIHYETNHRNSPKLVNYIADHSRLKTIINGGDNSSGEAIPENQIEWLYKTTADFSEKLNLYSVVGNHDDNSVGGNIVIPAVQVKRLMLPDPNTVTYGAGNYYYKDIDNTRFFFLDDQEGYRDTAQIDWIRNNLSESVDRYVFVMHMIYITDSATTPCTFFQDLLAMFNSIPENVKNKICAVFAGHQHHDHVYDFSGIKAITTTTDSRFADDGIPRTEGTLASQCFDVVYIDYEHRTINMYRIGSIGTDRTINY